MEINEVLNVLGYKDQELNPELEKLINNCIVEIQAVVNPKYIYEIYDVNFTDTVDLVGTTLSFKGKSVQRHFKGSKKIALLASTLGVEVDQKIKYYEKSNLTKSLVFDACASVYIETFCNGGAFIIDKIAKQSNYNTTLRYSPGYGDFSIEYQKEILQVLNAQKRIGLTCTDSYIMVPRKSITALIGFIEGEPNDYDPCDDCLSRENCSLRFEAGCMKKKR